MVEGVWKENEGGMGREWEGGPRGGSINNTRIATQ